MKSKSSSSKKRGLSSLIFLLLLKIPLLEMIPGMMTFQTFLTIQLLVIGVEIP